jgi:hypothetical protein
MNKRHCISIPREQSLPPASSAFRNIIRFLRLFAASFSAGPEREKTGLDRDKPGYSGIKSKNNFGRHFLPSHLISGHLTSSHIKNIFYFLTGRRACPRFQPALRGSAGFGLRISSRRELAISIPFVMNRVGFTFV